MSAENAIDTPQLATSPALFEPSEDRVLTEKDKEIIQEERDVMPSRTRDIHMDVLKGITMVLVIVSHMNVQDLLGYSLIGYLNMAAVPTFFFITGYLYATTSEAAMGFGRYFVRKCLTLLLPYTLFFFASIAWTETVYALSFGQELFSFPIDVPQMINAYLFAGQYLYEFPLVPVPIWFLHAMFIASLVFWVIMRVKRVGLLTIIALLLSVVTLPIQAAMGDSPLWIVKLLPAAVFFMLLGHLLWRFISQPVQVQKAEAASEGKSQNGTLVGAFFGLGCLLLSFFFYLYGGGIMWEMGSYWYFIGAMLSILGLYLLSRASTSLILQYVGTRSLLYLGLHPFVLTISYMEGLPAFLATQGMTGVLIFITYFIICFLISTLLVAIVDACLAPYRFLKRRRKAKKKAKQELRQEKEAYQAEKALQAQRAAQAGNAGEAGKAVQAERPAEVEKAAQPVKAVEAERAVRAEKAVQADSAFEAAQQGPEERKEAYQAEKADAGESEPLMTAPEPPVEPMPAPIAVQPEILGPSYAKPASADPVELFWNNSSGTKTPKRRKKPSKKK